MCDHSVKSEVHAVICVCGPRIIFEFGIYASKVQVCSKYVSIF